jgi:hypothetical protein
MPECNYRLTVGPEGHGYEVGYWPDGADMNDPSQYIVVAKCYGQQEAAALALAHAGDPVYGPSEASPAEQDEAPAEAGEEHPHRRTTKHRR